MKTCPVCGNPVTDPRRTHCSRACAGKARQNFRECVMCGAPFPCPSSSPQVTCSRECSSKHRVDLHVKGRYEAFQDAQKEGLQASPKTARGSEQHVNARAWVIQSPTGTIYECRNLLEWCRQNEERFDGTVKQAWDGLTKIKYSAQGKRRNPSHQWKGWRLLEWGD